MEEMVEREETEEMEVTVMALGLAIVITYQIIY